MRKLLAAFLLLVSLPALAQFTQGQVLTAAQLNNQFALYVPLTGATLTGPLTVPTLTVTGTTTLSSIATSNATITGGTISGLSSPIGFASGGTNAITATGATSSLQYLQGAANSVARSLTSKFQDMLNAKDFGATCNGTGTGDLTGIQATIAAAQILGGGNATLPAGNCVINGTLSVNSGNVKIVGAGRGLTTITQSSLTANTISFGGTAFDAGISDLTINQSGTPTAGYGILQTNGTGDIRVQNVRIQGTYYGVAQINTSVSGVLQLNNVDFSNIQADAMLLNGNSQFFASNVTSYSTVTGNCLRMLNSWGSYIVNMTCQSSAGAGINIAPTTGNTVTDAYFSNVEVDNTSGTGVNVDSSGGGSIYGLIFSNTRVGFGSGLGWSFNGPSTANITVNGSRAEKNVQDGLKILNVQDSSFINNQILGNSSTGTGYNGITISGGTGLTVNGNRVGPFFGTGNNQGYGISILSSFTGSMQIQNNELEGNLTGALNNASTSANISIAQNVGSGLFQIANNPQVYPSLWGTRSYYNWVVPNAGTWYDNALTIQNLSVDPTSHTSGNAAIRFADSVGGLERGAFGYSRVATGTIAGFGPDQLYVEVGNYNAGDPDDTDFQVLVDHVAGATYFPNTSLSAIHVESKTGNLDFNVQGSGTVNFGTIGGVPAEIDEAMTTTKGRIRERDNADNLAITTNVNLAGNQDNTSKPSWELVMGASLNAFQINQMPAGSTSPSTLPNLLNLDNNGNLTVKGRGIMPLYNTTGGGVNAPHMTTGSVALSSGSATVTLSGQVYTSSSSYTCTANDTTAAASVKVSQTSGTSITFTGTGTDTVQFICVGY
ncbi:TPA: right-handed parallel beta-helix repeat-containing protein [Burkholderia cepacia]|nr:right-handed parallel beta-helix repeat-containing protein [Burkholderia cepacia]